jgi:hypothetical protein
MEVANADTVETPSLSKQPNSFAREEPSDINYCYRSRQQRKREQLKSHILSKDDLSVYNHYKISWLLPCSPLS